MPDSGHVNDCAQHLMLAWNAYERMVRSGDDGGLQLSNEIIKLKLPEDGTCAALVWVEFLRSSREMREDALHGIGMNADGTLNVVEDEETGADGNGNWEGLSDG